MQLKITSHVKADCSEIKTVKYTWLILIQVHAKAKGFCMEQFASTVNCQANLKGSFYQKTIEDLSYLVYLVLKTTSKEKK